VSQHQKGCPDIIPFLTANNFWDNSHFPFSQQFIDSFDIIQQELVDLRNEKGFQPYRGPTWAGKNKASDGIGTSSTDGGNWNVFYLFLHNMKFDTNCQKVPKTVALIEKYMPRSFHHPNI